MKTKSVQLFEFYFFKVAVSRFQPKLIFLILITLSIIFILKLLSTDNHPIHEPRKAVLLCTKYHLT